MVFVALFQASSRTTSRVSENMRAKAAVKIAATSTTTQKLSLLDSELLIYRIILLIVH
jgi:hypothetical protein